MAKNKPKEPDPDNDKETQAISKLWKKVQENNDAILKMKGKINEIKADLKVAKSSLEQLQENQEKFIMENHEIQLELFNDLETEFTDPEKWREMPLMALNLKLNEVGILSNYFKSLGELDDFINNKIEKDVDDSIITQGIVDTAFESLQAFIADWKEYAKNKQNEIAQLEASKSNKDELIDDEDIDEDEEDDYDEL